MDKIYKIGFAVFIFSLCFLQACSKHSPLDGQYARNTTLITFGGFMGSNFVSLAMQGAGGYHHIGGLRWEYKILSYENSIYKLICTSSSIDKSFKKGDIVEVAVSGNRISLPESKGYFSGDFERVFPEIDIIY